MAKKKSTAGRKRLKPSEKKVLVGFYTRQDIIDGLGGKDTVRELSREYVEKAYYGLGSGALK